MPWCKRHWIVELVHNGYVFEEGDGSPILVSFWEVKFAKLE